MILNSMRMSNFSSWQSIYHLYGLILNSTAIERNSKVDRPIIQDVSGIEFENTMDNSDQNMTGNMSGDLVDLISIEVAFVPN